MVELRTALRFAATGLLNTAAGLCVIIATSKLLGWSPYLANVVGYAAGLAFGFMLNRRWTFANRAQVSITAPRYALAFGLSYGANLLVLALGLHWLSLSEVASQAAASIVYSGVFYLLCRYFVFSRPSA